ncbi:MAG: AGE family epimerase/isomerase [Lachnospiraceae bacterium]|nr:AGE family epimerase/isomerase [Lachnospiraceae bacterium]
MHTVEAFLAAADCLDSMSDEAGFKYIGFMKYNRRPRMSGSTGAGAGTDVKRPGDIYRTRAGRIIGRVTGWAEKNDYRIPEHFTKNWEPDLYMNSDRPDDPFKPYGATPGHGIEWARLIAQWMLSEGPQNRPPVPNKGPQNRPPVPESLYDRAIKDAWNSDGAEGIVYTTDWDGRPVVHDRMHWTLAEAINTSAVLYRITDDQRYAADYAAFMRYLDTTVLDHKTGSWFHQLDEKNQLKETVWPGKSDLYHAFQAMLIPYAVPGVSIAKAVWDRKNA